MSKIQTDFKKQESDFKKQESDFKKQESDNIKQEIKIPIYDNIKNLPTNTDTINDLDLQIVIIYL